MKYSYFIYLIFTILYSKFPLILFIKSQTPKKEKICSSILGIEYMKQFCFYEYFNDMFQIHKFATLIGSKYFPFGKILHNESRL